MANKSDEKINPFPDNPVPPELMQPVPRKSEAVPAPPPMTLGQPPAFIRLDKIQGQGTAKILSLLAVIFFAVQLPSALFSGAIAFISSYPGLLLIDITDGLKILFFLIVSILLFRAVGKYQINGSSKSFFVPFLLCGAAQLLFVLRMSISFEKGFVLFESPFQWLMLFLYYLPILVAYFYIAFDLKNGGRHLKISRVLILCMIAIMLLIFMLEVIVTDIPMMRFSYERLNRVNDTNFFQSAFWSDIKNLGQRVISFLIPSIFAIVLWKMMGVSKAEEKN